MGIYSVLAVQYQPEVAFGTDPAGTRLRLDITEPPDFSPALEKLFADIPEYGMAEHVAQLGSQGGEFSLKLMLRGSGVPADKDTAAAPSEISPFLESIMTRVESTPQQGTLVTAGSSGADIKITHAESTQFDPGQLVLTAAKKAYAVRAVAAGAGSDPDTLTVDRSVTPTPEAAQALYNSLTLGLLKAAASLGAAMPSFTFDFITSDYKLTLRGCYLTALTLDGQAGKPALATLNFAADSFVYAATAAPVARATWPSAIRAASGRGVWDDAEIMSGQVEVAFGLEVKAIPSIAGAHGRGGAVLTGFKPRVTVKTPYAASLLADYEADTPKEFLMQFGDVPGNVFAVYIPAAVVEEFPRVDYEGREGRTMKIRPTTQSALAHDFYLGFL